MTYVRNAVILILLMLGVTAAITITFISRNTDEDNRISAYLKLSSLSINTHYVDIVANKIRNGDEPYNIVSMLEYQELVKSLKNLTSLFPLKAKWTYITANKIDKNNNLQLIVLTIPFNYYDFKTYPGYKISTTDYMMFKNIVNGEDEIQISSIVYDKDYGIWTKTGAIKLFHNNKFVGVLAVDLEVEFLLQSLIQQIILYIVLNSVLFLFYIYIFNRNNRK